MKSIGEKIRMLRIAVGISQERLAEYIGCNIKSVQRYETGRSCPDTQTLVKLATYFDISTDYLLGLIGIKAEAQEEKNKIFREGQYNELYKQYLECKNYILIDEHSTYYWIYFGDKENVSGQTEWVGWADDDMSIEIRRLRPVIPQAAIEMCTRVYEKPLLINNKNDSNIFRIFGGHAIVKASVCKKYLPEFYEDYISPKPEY